MYWRVLVSRRTPCTTGIRWPKLCLPWQKNRVPGRNIPLWQCQFGAILITEHINGGDAQMWILGEEQIFTYLRSHYPAFDQSGPVDIQYIGAPEGEEKPLEPDEGGLINHIFRLSNGKQFVIVKQGRSASRKNDKIVLPHGGTGRSMRRSGSVMPLCSSIRRRPIMRTGRTQFF